MRLQAVFDGKVYVSDGRDVLVSDGQRQFVRVGQLPLPNLTRDGLIARILTSRRWRPMVDRIIGAVSTVNVWPLSESDLLATMGGRLYVSGDQGQHWELTRRLPPSSGPMGVLPSAVEHHGGRTYLGEYPLRESANPRVLVSDDHGSSWSTLITLANIRHVHAVQRDPYSGDLWMTTGDTDTQSQIGRLRDGAFEVVGGGSQEFRAVELAFTPSSILWGMDCGYADANRLFKLPRENLDTPDPNPQPVGQVPGSVYYSASLTVEGAHWVVFSTAMEAGRDSTGPTTQPGANGRGVVVAASSASDFDYWHELASFQRRRVLTDRLPGGLARANGYVFLDADPEQGLFINPYNTAADDGIIRNLTLERFARLAHRHPIG